MYIRDPKGKIRPHFVFKLSNCESELKNELVWFLKIIRAQAGCGGTHLNPSTLQDWGRRVLNLSPVWATYQDPVAKREKKEKRKKDYTSTY